MMSITKLAKELRIKEPDLITRPVGKSMFEKIRQKLEFASDGEVVVLDFEGIRVIDSSFIDEFLVRLITLACSSQKKMYIKLKNISRVSEINIDLVFKSYSQYNNRRIAVVTEDLGMNNTFFIGPLSELECRIIEYLRRNRTVHLRDLHQFTEAPEEELRKTVHDLSSLGVIRAGDGEAYTTV